MVRHFDAGLGGDCLYGVDIQAHQRRHCAGTVLLHQLAPPTREAEGVRIGERLRGDKGGVPTKAVTGNKVRRGQCACLRQPHQVRNADSNDGRLLVVGADQLVIWAGGDHPAEIEAQCLVSGRE